jgi:serine/threonine-protein kinase
MTGELVAGRYRMKRRLGAGGMATVFLAKDCRLERDVAIKRLHADSPEEIGRRFQREAKVGASLNHPNIVGVYDTVTDDEGLLIVMEYVAGHTLRDEIARGRMDPDRVLEVLEPVASALDHAHAAGVVHRDVKPANVLIDDGSETVKLADLGIATAAERTRITHSGAVLGTASYMAPERLDGGAGGPAVDIYALAAMAFEMLSGSKAITGKTPLEIARRVATQPPPDLRDLVPRAPDAAADALRRGLAKEPEDRQASAGELVRQLGHAYAEQSTAPKPVPAPVPRQDRAEREPMSAAPAEIREPTTAPRMHRSSRRPGWLVPAALAALLALAAVAAVLATSGGGDEPSTAADSGAASSSATEEPAREPDRSDSGGAAAPEEEQAPEAESSAPAEATPPPESGTPSSPDGAVSAFYSAAASDDYDAAWSLSTERLHEQVEGYDSFVASQSTLETIEFPALEVTDQKGNSAVVAFQSVARHESFTDRCEGSIAVVRSRGTWMVDHIDAASCDRS